MSPPHSTSGRLACSRTIVCVGPLGLALHLHYIQMLAHIDFQCVTHTITFAPVTSGHKKNRPLSCYTEWPIYPSPAESYCLPIVIVRSWHNPPAPGAIRQMQLITVLSFEPEPYIIYLFKNFALQNYSFSLKQPNLSVFFFVFSDILNCYSLFFSSACSVQ